MGAGEDRPPQVPPGPPAPPPPRTRCGAGSRRGPPRRRPPGHGFKLPKKGVHLYAAVGQRHLVLALGEVARGVLHVPMVVPWGARQQGLGLVAHTVPHRQFWENRVHFKNILGKC